MHRFLLRKQTTFILSRRLNMWSNIKMAPTDPILGLTEAFKADQSPSKINLGVGAYRDDSGKPFVLKSVRQAEERIMASHMDKEYAGIAGIPAFVRESLEFGYGEDSEAIRSGSIAAVQSISGTGGCRLMAEFIARFFGAGKKIYIPKPTWGNHVAIMKDAGLEPVYYKYYESSTTSLDFEGMVADFRAAEEGSLVMLHACAHNPTGCDPTIEQWDTLSQVLKEKKHMVFLDCAYQGFASGDPDRDAYSIRKFVADGHQIMLAQSYAKNFGLYGERVGCFSVVTSSTEEAAIVSSQLKVLVRALYSSPPIHGARIVAQVLSDAELKALWYSECKAMADRINSMRSLLRGKLEASTSRSWKHVTDQIGMFCYTGLSPAQVQRLREEFHVYCTADGRFSMAGINSGNIDYLAASVAKVIA